MRDTERLLASYTDKLVKAKKLRKHYTMQTLRHAAISYMLMGGASKDEVASYTGVTGKWMNRYDKIIADNVINVAANYNVININPSKIDKMYLNNYNYTMNKIHNCGLYKNMSGGIL